MEFLALIIVVGAILILQSVIFKKCSFRNLDYTCELSTDEAEEGDNIELIETVVNKKWLPIPWLKAEITTSKWLDFAGAQSVITDQSRFVPSFFMVKSYQKVQRKWKVTCLKRGVFDLQKIVLVSTDLLGGATLSHPTEVDSQITVLPKTLDLDELFLSPKYLSGDTVVKRHLLEDPFYFAGVREYTERDPMNKIHWLATAKQQKIMVHQNDYTSRQSFAVILNMQSMPYEVGKTVYEETVENGIRVCASLFENTISDQIPVCFFSNTTIDGENDVISTEAWGEEHVMELRRLLAHLSLKSTQPFGEFLNMIYDSVSSTDIILVSAYLSEEIIEFMRNKEYSGVHVTLYLTGFVSSGELPDDCEIYCLADHFREKEEETDEKSMVS